MIVLKSLASGALLPLGIFATSVAHSEQSIWVADSGVLQSIPHQQRYQGRHHHALMRRGPADTQGGNFSRPPSSSLIEESSRDKAANQDLDSAFQDSSRRQDYDPYFLFRMQEHFNDEKKKGALVQGGLTVHSAATSQLEGMVERQRAKVREQVRMEVELLMRADPNCSVYNSKRKNCTAQAACNYLEDSEDCIAYDCIAANPSAYTSSGSCSSNSICQWNSLQSACDYKVCADLVTEEWCKSSRVCQYVSSTCKPKACSEFSNEDVCGNIAACSWDSEAATPTCVAKQCEGYDESDCGNHASNACYWDSNECKSAFRLTKTQCENHDYAEWVTGSTGRCRAKCSAFSSTTCDGEGYASFHQGCAWAEVDSSDDGITENTCINVPGCSDESTCSDNTAEECDVDTDLQTKCKVMCGTCKDYCKIYGTNTCSSKSCTVVGNECRMQCEDILLQEDCELDANNHCSWSGSACTDAGSLSAMLQGNKSNIAHTTTKESMSSIAKSQKTTKTSSSIPQNEKSRKSNPSNVQSTKSKRPSSMSAQSNEAKKSTSATTQIKKSKTSSK